jgi:hypothetical protein
MGGFFLGDADRDRGRGEAERIPRVDKLGVNVHSGSWYLAAFRRATCAVPSRDSRSNTLLAAHPPLEEGTGEVVRARKARSRALLLDIN